MHRASGILAVSFALLLALPAAQAATYTAILNGATENPATPSSGIGGAIVTLDTTAHTLRVGASFSGLTGTTTAAHIHCCVAPPGNVGVATQTPSFVGFPLGVTSGSMDVTYDTTQAATWNAGFITNNGGTVAGAEAALAAGLAAGQAYLNIHSSAHTSGEIRGFLEFQAPAHPVPANSQWIMGGLVLLLAAGAWVVLRRRRG